MAAKCPICGQRTFYEGAPYRPFCSERCQLLDLDNWLSERYRIPVTAGDRAQDVPAPEPIKGDKGCRD